MVGFVRISMLAIATWGAAGIATWYGYTIPQPSKVVAAARHNAEPELAAPTDLKLDLALLSKSDIWGARAIGSPAAAGATVAPPAAEVWTRIAVVKEASGAFVLLSSPTGQIKPFKAGDLLPDGSKLISASPAEIVVKPASGKSQSVHLLN